MNKPLIQGTLPVRRNDKHDWNDVWTNDKNGNIELIPPELRIRYYNSIKRIEKDHLQPIGIVKQVYCFWGKTGTGKSRTAWEMCPDAISISSLFISF